ncbi:MAG: hypothetical protein P4L46_04755 [Fimbriimonas sp.]|nr:hypothetical protein [Fimbriimonas sp.]
MSQEFVTRAEFDALRSQIRELTKQIQGLQAKLPNGNDVTEETAQVLAAAVAAYLGKRATVRIIRIDVASDQWRLQGRAALQASHAMPRTRAIHR